MRNSHDEGGALVLINEAISHLLSDASAVHWPSLHDQPKLLMPMEIRLLSVNIPN